MDQRVVAGIGNVYKSETCFLTGIDPWRPVGTPERGGGRARSAPPPPACWPRACATAAPIRT